MRYGADAADPLRQDQRALDRPSFDRFLDPAMRVEEPGLEIEHGLAHPAEAEVARLDDPGVDRPDRNLPHSIRVHPGPVPPRGHAPAPPEPRTPSTPKHTTRLD